MYVLKRKAVSSVTSVQFQKAIKNEANKTLSLVTGRRSGFLNGTTSIPKEFPRSGAQREIYFNYSSYSKESL